MAAMNSSVLACNYAISGAAGMGELNAKVSCASPVGAAQKLPAIRAQRAKASEPKSDGRRAAMLYLAATLFTTAATASSANAGIIEEYLARSQANKVALLLLLLIIIIIIFSEL